MGGTRRGTRLTQREAAERLGVSVEAIRKRVKRGTLRSEKEEDGRRYVYLDDAPDAAHPQADHAGHAHPQADHAGHAYPQAEGRRYADPAPLVEELRDQVGYLREQLRREQDAHAEARRIIAALAARIPEIEAPASSEEPGVPEMAADEQQGRGPIPDATGAQEGAQRPWWRRIFG